MPPWAASLANFALSFADEHARINSGIATSIGAINCKILRHIGSSSPFEKISDYRHVPLR
jgi:hypothetical protein